MTDLRDARAGWWLVRQHRLRGEVLDAVEVVRAGTAWLYHRSGRVDRVTGAPDRASHGDMYAVATHPTEDAARAEVAELAEAHALRERIRALRGGVHALIDGSIGNLPLAEQVARLERGIAALRAALEVPDAER